LEKVNKLEGQLVTMDILKETLEVERLTNI
jgi:hypothetical protein